MIDSMLDVLLGHFWRTFVTLYTGAFAWIVLPLTAWMVLMIVARRAPAVAESRIRVGLRGIGSDSAKLSGRALVARLRPEVAEVAERFRLMPSRGGLWVRRCEFEALAQACGLNPTNLVKVRDEMLRVGRTPTASRSAIKAASR